MLGFIGEKVRPLIWKAIRVWGRSDRYVTFCRLLDSRSGIPADAGESFDRNTELMKLKDREARRVFQPKDFYRNGIVSFVLHARA